MGCARAHAALRWGPDAVDAPTVRRWLEGSAAALHEQRDYLTQLDAAIGDADHGMNMDRGFRASSRSSAARGSEPPGRILVTPGATLVSTVGGACGPLWGTALRRAGRSLGDAATFDGAALAVALGPRSTASSSSARRSPATRRWSTRSPAVRTLKPRWGPARRRGLRGGRDAAEEGMRATVPLRARRGARPTWGSGATGTRIRARPRPP